MRQKKKTLKRKETERCFNFVDSTGPQIWGRFPAQKADNPKGVRTVRTPFGLSAFWAENGPIFGTRVGEKKIEFQIQNSENLGF